MRILQLDIIDYSHTYSNHIPIQLGLDVVLDVDEYNLVLVVL